MPPFFDPPRRRWRGLDRVVRMMIVNWALGIGVGAALATGTLACDAFGLRTLLWRSDVAALGAAVFIALFALTFGGVVAATAAMRAGRDDDEPGGGLRAPGFVRAAARGAR